MKTRVSNLHPNYRAAINRLCTNAGLSVSSRTKLSHVKQFFSIQVIEREAFVESIRGNRTPLELSESFALFCKRAKSPVFKKILKWSHLADTSECNYLTLRGEGSKLITFHPRPALQVFNGDGAWVRDGRQEIKIQALLVRLFGQKILKFISNADIELASSELKNESAPITMQEVSIEDAYAQGSSADGWVRSSCMACKGDEIIELYTNNRDSFTGVLFYKGAEIVGRCLKVSINDGGSIFTYYDRVYCKYEETLNAIHGLFNGLDVVYMPANSYHVKNSFYSVSRGAFSRNLCLQLNADTTDDDPYNAVATKLPYVDTLTYLYQCKDTGDWFIQNHYPQNSECDKYFVMSQVGGSAEQISVTVWDDIDSCYIDPDDAVEVGIGYRAGATTHVDNCFYSNANDCYVLC